MWVSQDIYSALKVAIALGYPEMAVQLFVAGAVPERPLVWVRWRIPPLQLEKRFAVNRALFHLGLPTVQISERHGHFVNGQPPLHLSLCSLT